MEMDLKNLIDRIKSEGVDEAEKKAADILKKAEEEAADILRKAERQAKGTIAKAEEEAAKAKKNGEAALDQAARDVVLGLRENILSLFDKAVKAEVGKGLSDDVIRQMLLKLAEGVAKGKDMSLEILLSEEDREKLADLMTKALSEEIKSGVTVKASKHVDKGFRIGEKDGSAYYDFTDDAITEAFNSYLGPKMAQRLDPKRK